MQTSDRAIQTVECEASEVGTKWHAVVHNGRFLVVTPWKAVARNVWKDRLKTDLGDGAGLISFKVKAGEVAGAMPLTDESPSTWWGVLLDEKLTHFCETQAEAEAAFLELDNPKAALVEMRFCRPPRPSTNQ